MRALGFAVAFGIDSNSVPFLSEIGTTFALTMAGLVLCVLSAARYTTDSFYGEEERVILPETFDKAILPSPLEISGDAEVVKCKGDA